MKLKKQRAREKELKKLEKQKIKEKKLLEKKGQEEKIKKEKTKEREKEKKEDLQSIEKKVVPEIEKEPIIEDTTTSTFKEKITEESSINETLNESNLDNDVEKLLPIIDSLLEKLPEEVIDDFANSDYFQLYEKVMNKYKNK
jgi:hypothetical protein